MSDNDHGVLAQLLKQNIEWATQFALDHPGFFEESAKHQDPKVLWIGCADSRVPESVVTASMPGDIFVHRNIANQFLLNDINALSVLAYAVEHLSVTDILIVGHSNCGGVAACYDAAHGGHPIDPDTPLGEWLAPLIALAEEKIELTVSELEVENVRVQVGNVANSPAIKAAWEEGKDVWVHGCLYQLEDGHLRDLMIVCGPESYRYH